MYTVARSAENERFSGRNASIVSRWGSRFPPISARGRLVEDVVRGSILLTIVMRLDATALRYLSDDDFRVLTAVELGMRNHELVPVTLINNISSLRHGGCTRSLKQVHKHKLVHRETRRYVGYRLTPLGYDFLALRALTLRGIVSGIGNTLGVGKEADVVVATPSAQLSEELSAKIDNAELELAVKIHRLGRTSFRAVKSKRDYLQHRKAASWIYMSRLAAVKEYAFLCALFEHEFPVPRPLGQSRHVVVMELIHGVQLNQVSELANPDTVAAAVISVIARLAKHGLVHCDLNEFNVIIDDDEQITVIDFPQMVSTRHPDAKMLYDRDQDGVVRFFSHRFGVDPSEIAKVPFESAIASPSDNIAERIDTALCASGCGNDNASTLSGPDSIDHGIVQGVTERSNEGCTASYEPEDLASLPANGPDGEDVHGGREGGSANEAPSMYAVDVDLAVADNAPLPAISDSHDRDVHDSRDDGSFAESTVRVDQSKIAYRVRRQRANQARRRQMSKRNVVKDSEKRKLKAEADRVSFWSDV